MERCYKAGKSSREKSEVSRFKVDGVVAEMVIEVDEENEISSQSTFSISDGISYKELGLNTEKDKAAICSDMDITIMCAASDSVVKSTNIENYSSAVIKNERSPKKTKNVSNEGNQTMGQKSREAEEKISSTCVPTKSKKRKFQVEGANDKKDSTSNKSSRRQNHLANQENIVNAKEVTESKKIHLRKLPFRKTETEIDLPTLEPKVVWINGVGQGSGLKLGSISELCNRIRGAKRNGLRPLYRTIYYQWPPNDINKVIYQILQFNGFPFDETSFEFVKRRRILKSLLDSTISHICKILGINPGTKTEMVTNILTFLMKPYRQLRPEMDVSMQPYVRLEKINLDNEYLSQTVTHDALKKIKVSNRICTLPTNIRKNSKPTSSKTVTVTERVRRKKKVEPVLKASSVNKRKKDVINEVKNEILSETEDFSYVHEERSSMAQKQPFAEQGASQDKPAEAMSDIKIEQLDNGLSQVNFMEGKKNQ